MSLPKVVLVLLVDVPLETFRSEREPAADLDGARFIERDLKGVLVAHDPTTCH